MQLISHDLGVDLGTSNVRIYVDGKGVISREPSVVAVDKNTGKILQVGAAARNMLGRTPGNVVAMSPLKDGVISDHEMTVKMLQILFRSVSKSSLFTPKPRVIVSVPSSITEVEERTVINAAIEAGARRVYLIEAPLAAALGANLDIKGPNGHMVVDVGGGTCNVAVLSMNGVAVSSSIPIGGIAFDETIARYVRRNYGVIVGETTAEEVKIQIGSVYPRQEDPTISIRGRDAKNGTPRELTLTSSEIFNVLQRPARMITDEVLSVLEDTTPELVADIAENGITLTGGGSLLHGMDRLLEKQTKIHTALAEDPVNCVAIGTGKSFQYLDKLVDGFVIPSMQRF